MPRSALPLVLGLLVALAACSPLAEDEIPPENLVPLASLPADYGELVTVLHYNVRGPIVWDELWFENADTGTLTRVPVHRPTWSYDPTRVRQIQRAPGGARDREGES